MRVHRFSERPNLDARRGCVGRRAVLAGAAAALAGRTGHAQVLDRIDWRRHAGTRLSVLFQKSPRSDLLAASWREFEAMTGMTVAFEAIPEQQQRQKMVIEFASGRPSFDVANISVAVQKRQVERGGWFTDLRPLFGAMEAFEEFDGADFSKAALAYGTGQSGRLEVLPTNFDYWVLYYNKELLERAGVAYPETQSDLMRACAKVQKLGTGAQPWICRGQKNANVPVWTTLLLGHGQEVLDSAGSLLTDTDAAVEAATLYTRLAREFGPPGVSGFNWGECQTSFLQGRAAFWLDGIGFAAPLENPQVSRVAGKIGYGVVPAGPLARHTALFGDGIGIAEASRNKEAAFLYLVWATDKANQARMLRHGAGVPARHSPLTDRSTVAGSPFGSDWFATLLESARIARSPLPEVVPVTEFRDIFGVALCNMLEGADPKQELRRATDQYRPVLDASERA